MLEVSHEIKTKIQPLKETKKKKGVNKQQRQVTLLEQMTFPNVRVTGRSHELKATKFEEQLGFFFMNISRKAQPAEFSC